MELTIVYCLIFYFFFYTLLQRHPTKQFFILLGIFGLFLVSSFRSYKLDMDCSMYRGFYDGYPDNIGIVEFSYSLITAVVKRCLNDFRYMLIIYSAIALSVSYVGIRKLSVHQPCSYMMFTGSFFLLQNMTQIRAACAVAFFLLSIPYLVKKDYGRFFVCCGFATFFHYSAAVMFALPLIDNSPITDRKRKILLLIPIVAILVSSALDVTSLLMKIPVPYIQAKVQGYIYLIEMQSGGQDYIKVFNVLFLLKLAVYYWLVLNSDFYSRKFKLFPILIKIYSISIVSLPALSLIPAMATRYNEFFGVLDIILYPMILVTFKQYKFISCLLLAYPLLVSYVYIFRNQFFNI